MALVATPRSTAESTSDKTLKRGLKAKKRKGKPNPKLAYFGGRQKQSVNY